MVAAAVVSERRISVGRAGALWLTVGHAHRHCVRAATPLAWRVELSSCTDFVCRDEDLTVEIHQARAGLYFLDQRRRLKGSPAKFVDDIPEEVSWPHDRTAPQAHAQSNLRASTECGVRP